MLEWLGGGRWRDRMSQPSRVLAGSEARVKWRRALRGWRIDVCCLSRLCHLVGESGKEIGDGDDDADEHAMTVGATGFCEKTHGLWCDVSKGFVFPGYARRVVGFSSLERLPLGSTGRAGRRPLRGSTCPLGYSPKCPSHCRPCRPRILVSL